MGAYLARAGDPAFGGGHVAGKPAQRAESAELGDGLGHHLRRRPFGAAGGTADAPNLSTTLRGSANRPMLDDQELLRLESANSVSRH